MRNRQASSADYRYVSFAEPAAVGVLRAVRIAVGRCASAVAATAVSLACAGCGGGSQQPPPTGLPRPSGVGTSGASHAAALWGTDAVALARDISGCSGPQRLSGATATAAAPVLAAAPQIGRSAGSMAVCAVEGHRLLILAVPDIKAQATLEDALSPHVGYYSAGPGWVAAPVGRLAAVPELSLVQAAAQDLGGSVIRGGAQP